MNYRHAFIELALSRQVLKFGDFTLKSGRQSPYFFNTGLFNTGADLAALGDCYARTIEDAGLDYDMLFGPAYKGIPLVSATALCLAIRFDKAVPYCFDRKEIKDHGEGGKMVGAPLQGKVIIVDDVISAGTAIREAITVIQSAGADVAGVVVALDRQERGQNHQSAIQEVESEYAIPVRAVITLNDLLDYLQSKQPLSENFSKVSEYRQMYGVDS